MKSRLRVASEPFGYIKVYLYHEPVKNQYKITDIEIYDLFATIRLSVVKFYAVSLWAEICLRSYGGGLSGEEAQRFFQLLLDALVWVDRLPPERVVFVTLQFLIRFLALAGYPLDLSSCHDCGRDLALQEPVFAVAGDFNWCCAQCARPGMIEIPAGARRYVEKTQMLPLDRAITIGLQEASLVILKKYLYQLVQGLIGMPLNSLKSGVEIL